VLRTEYAAEKPNPVLEPAVAPPTVEATEVHKAGVTAQYDGLYEVGRIGKYVQNLEAQLKQNRQTLQNVERDWQQTRNELGVARREREEARRQAAVDHESVACIEAENNGLKSEVERLRLEILRLKGQITATENRHEQAAASHAAQLDTLSERIEREGEHRVGAFRNKLAAKVQTYADGLKDANAMQMTEELGTAIRNQLRQLLRLLKAEGVRIHGDL
jgi:chromosome segregation ATPase